MDDGKIEAVNQQKYRVFQQPKWAWKCYLTPIFTIQTEEKHTPNAFHRWMQTLCFGFKWEKIDG